ncbi:MAG: hypothetical protein B6D35_00220 [Candidatus Brocadia sp. UTAMX2]|jgi:electron transfer flavoprotein beta subunit|nr:MAG: hypothetical protein B6D35_00220 [Candidatus Brocadia sp. UTAMX2]
MNIYACVKQVPDTETRIKLVSDNNWIDTTGVKWVMSSYDEFAVEEALRVKEKNPGSIVTIVSAGPARVEETIRTALAMGADNGIHVDVPETADTYLVAKALAGALKKEEKVDIVFTGKEATDDGAAQVSQFLAGHLGFSCVTNVLQGEYFLDKVKCKREVEGGAFEIVETVLPAIISAEKGMNEPRYATLPNILKAKKKEIRRLSMDDVGVSASDQKIRLKNLQLPPQKQPAKKIEGDPEAQAKELVRLLRQEARLV